MVRLRPLDLHVFQKLFRWLKSLPLGWQTVLLVSIYVITGLVLDEAAAEFETSDGITAWYPPAALHIVLLLRFGLRYIPELLFVPLLDGLVFTPQDIEPFYVLLCALCTMLSYGTACAFLLHKLRIDPHLLRFRDVLWFTIVALVASLIVAISSVTTLAAAGDVSWSKWGARVLHYWAGDATGIAMLAPPLLLLLRAFPSDGPHTFKRPTVEINIRPKGWDVLEWVAEVIAVGVISWTAYGVPSAVNLDYTYFIFLPIIWIAMRHGFERTVLAVLLLNISVALYVGTNFSVTNELALQFGLMTVSYTGLLVGAVITQHNRAEEQLLYNAAHDSLTKLYNRSGFMDKLEQALAGATQNENYLLAVIFLDLDRFKVVNDSLGHAIGDKLLCAFAHRLKVCLRAEDTVARFGGDEFTILLEDIKDISYATRLGQRINEELGRSFKLDGYYVFTTTSIGIAPSSIGHARSAADLIRDANIAMYRAKAQGRAQYEVFDRAMHDDIVMLSQLENDLRRDIEGIGTQPATQFHLYYQPIVSLSTGTISGFEALIRWEHPARGLVLPAQFIPLAEETGLIVPIGRWVLREACRQMHTWQLAFSHNSPSMVAVNLSGKQFLQLDLVEQIDQILQETGLKAGNLKLEITESVVMENSAEAAVMLERLKALGVQLSIDDLGTGYSSLSRLHSFPMNTLKIDRSFVSQMGTEGENSEIVQAIIVLAHQIGMNVTAEGVETAAQLTKLKELKCEEGQGYFFSRPLTSQAAQELIAAAPQW